MTAPANRARARFSTDSRSALFPPSAEPRVVLPLPAAAAHVTVRDAAAALGVSVPTLRRLLRAGAPQAVQGRRGRGRRALIDVVAVRAWRAAQSGREGDFADVLRIVAGDVPKILAESAWRAFLDVNATDKRQIAGALGAAWYLGATAVRDYLTHFGCELPEIAEAPKEIDQLLRHFKRFR
jgi:hypothetical protein